MHATTRMAAIVALILLMAGCADPGIGGKKKDPGAGLAYPTTAKGLPYDPRDPGVVFDPKDPCIYGLAEDDEKRPLGNVTVTVVELNKTVRSNSIGQFRICRLWPHWYNLRAQLDGYKNTTKEIETRDGRGNVTLALEKIIPPHIDKRPYKLEIDYGFGTAYSLGTMCSPCNFAYTAPVVPSHILWEAKWTRGTQVGASDRLQYQLKGANHNYGSATTGQPMRIIYDQKALTVAPNVKVEAKGPFTFTGTMECADVCSAVDINVYFSVFYSYPSVPQNYTMIP